MGPAQPNGEHIPTATLHSDMGCDTYAFPAGSGDGVNPLVCEASEEEKRTAQRDAAWWKATLGEFYHGFFDEQDYPKRNFCKIMHIHVTDSIISRYKEVKFVWAHVGLCMELMELHPAVHAKIVSSFFERHATNLWLDLSWDVLAKQNFVNHDGRAIEEVWSSWASEDLTDDALFDMVAISRERERLESIWLSNKDSIKLTVTTLTGPTYKMAVLLNLMSAYPDRFLPGTDYVASFGVHDDFPGYTPSNGEPLSPKTAIQDGCRKTEMTHSQQITDTSSLNMFFNDELFTSVVLGHNFFKVANLETQFAPPPLCRHDPAKAAPTATVGWRPSATTAVELASATPAALSTLIDYVSRVPAPASALPGGALQTTAPSWQPLAMLVPAALVLAVASLTYYLGRKQGREAVVRLQNGSAPLLEEQA